jgi:ribosomal protein L17
MRSLITTTRRGTLRPTRSSKSKVRSKLLLTKLIGSIREMVGPRFSGLPKLSRGT